MTHPRDIMYGDKLKEFRGNHSQFWLATSLNITQPLVSDYEQGKRPYTEAFIKQICNLFKISVNEFKHPLLTPTLINFLGEIEKLGLPGNSQAPEDQQLLVIHLMLELHTVALENHTLKWKVKQYEDASARIKRHRPGTIFVLA